MIKIKMHSWIEEHTTYSLDFERADGKGGFGFPCDQFGAFQSTPGSAHSLAMCLAGQDSNGQKIRPMGVRTMHGSYRHPAIGECHCGREIELGRFTNTCKCGREFNSAGQELAPREQWGEETGEHWSECVGQGEF